MNLRQKKIHYASRAMKIIEERGLLETVGGAEGIYFSKLRDMSMGKDTPYDKGMAWIRTDSLYQDRELFDVLENLHSADFWLRKFRWLPWV